MRVSGVGLPPLDSTGWQLTESRSPAVPALAYTDCEQAIATRLGATDESGSLLLRDAGSSAVVLLVKFKDWISD